jgi:acyl-ACP thioesterase
MASFPGATEFQHPTESGRTIVRNRPVRLGDVDRRSTLRLDALARYLQDVALDDSTDSGLDMSLGWIARRTQIDVHQPAVFDESLELTTYCSGTGRSWAERSTLILGDKGARIEAVGLWVQVVIATGRPSMLSDEFREVYSDSHIDRKVSARLSLPALSDDVDVRPWTIRRTDIDPFNHVNNAANWSFLEEILGASGSARIGRAEMEFVAPLQFGAETELHIARQQFKEMSAWLVADGSVRSAARWTQPLQ